MPNAGKGVRASHDWFALHLIGQQIKVTWREFFKQVTKRSNADPRHMPLTVDTQVKVSLNGSIAVIVVICGLTTNEAKCQSALFLSMCCSFRLVRIPQQKSILSQA